MRPFTPMRWLLFCSIVLLSSCNADKIARLEKENKDLRDQLSATTKAASIELQGRCAAQARSLFTHSYQALPVATFTNHYNATLNRCFLSLNTIEFSRDGTSRTSVIIDAFEGKELATLIARGKKGEGPNSSTTIRCDAILPTGQSLKCKSPAEFETVTKVYTSE
jgi:hypothetical protein